MIRRLTNLRLDGGRKYECTLKPISEKRSIPQNKLYHLWVTIISVETGQPKEEVHEILKAKYIGVDIVEFAGMKLAKPRSTTTLDMKEFSRFMTDIKRDMKDMDIELPDADSKDLAECIAFYSEYL